MFDIIVFDSLDQGITMCTFGIEAEMGICLHSAALKDAVQLA